VGRRRPEDEYVPGAVTRWNAEEGWGAVSSAAVDGEVFVHFSAIAGEGYRELEVGEPVRFRYETPGQDGYPHRARSVMRDA
jgi:cold shock protein